MRDAYVTRTIESTIVNFIGVNTSTMEVIRGAFEVPGKVDESKALKVAMKWASYNMPEVSVAKIESCTMNEALYGMKESDFLKNAIELDPTTRKPLGTRIGMN